MLSDALAPVLLASGGLALFIVLRTAAALWLRPGHPLNRAADAADGPLWSVRPADTPHPPNPGVGGPPGGDGCG